MIIIFYLKDFPGDILSATYSEGSLRPRTEVDRRRKYINMMETRIGSDHPLNLLVKQCLHNVPHLRPSASDLFKRLKKLNDGDCNALYESGEVRVA